MEDQKQYEYNDGRHPAAFKELLHVIRFVLDTKNLGIMFKPTGNASKTLEIVCFSDRDYARDLVSRRHASKFMLYI